MKVITFLLFITFLCSFSNSFGQEDKLDSLLDKVLFEDDEILSMLSSAKNFQFIYARTNYENSTYFAGRDLGINQFNTTAQLVYFHSVGVHAGIGGVWYSKFDPKWYATLLTAGYSGRFDKTGDYRFRASFDRYFFAKDDSLDHSFTSSLNGGVTIDKEFIGTRLDASLLMGKESGAQVSWDIFGDIRLLKLGTFDHIKFEPEISFYFGSEEVAYARIGRVPGRLPKIYYEYQNKFGLLNTEIMFPFTMDYKNFDFEIGYNINLPKTFQPNTDLPVTSYFNFSVGYIISLN